MRLGSIMTKKVITVGSEEPVLNAARKMREANVGCLVVAEDRSVKGIITDRDLVVGCFGAGHDAQQCHISGHMSTPVITAEPTMDITDASRLMTHKGIKRLPVVKDGELIGLVSFSDIAKAMEQPMHDVLIGVGATKRSQTKEPTFLLF